MYLLELTDGHMVFSRDEERSCLQAPASGRQGGGGALGGPWALVPDVCWASGGQVVGPPLF